MQAHLCPFAKQVLHGVQGGIHRTDADVCHDLQISANNRLHRRSRRDDIPGHHRNLLEVDELLFSGDFPENGLGDGVEVCIGDPFALISKFLDPAKYLCQLLFARHEPCRLDRQFHSMFSGMFPENDPALLPDHLRRHHSGLECVGAHEHAVRVDA